MIEAILIVFIHCGRVELVLLDKPESIHWGAIDSPEELREVQSLIEQLKADPAVRVHEVKYDRDCKVST